MRTHLGLLGARHGSALVFAVLTLLVLMALSVVLLSAVGTESSALLQERRLTRLREAGELGLALRLLELNGGDLSTTPQSYPFPGVSVEVELSVHGPNRVSLRATATGLELSSELHAIAERTEIPVFSKALAANSELTLEQNNEIPHAFDSGIGLPGSGNLAGAGEIHSNGTVEIENYSVVQGDVSAGVSVELENNTSIAGIIRSPSIIAESTQAAGFDYSEPRLIEMPLRDAEIDTALSTFAALGLTDAGNVSVSSGDTLSLGPGNHLYHHLDVSGRLELQGPLTLMLEELDLANSAVLHATGAITVLIDSGSATGLKLDNGAQIFLPDRGDGWADAHFEIYTKSDIKIRSDGNAMGAPPRPVDFQIWMYSGTEIKFEVQPKIFYGTIYNPGGEAEFSQQTAFFGSIVADVIHLRNFETSGYDVALQEQLTMLREHFVITTLSTRTEVSP